MEGVNKEQKKTVVWFDDKSEEKPQSLFAFGQPSFGRFPQLRRAENFMRNSDLAVKFLSSCPND